MTVIRLVVRGKAEVHQFVGSGNLCVLASKDFDNYIHPLMKLSFFQQKMFLKLSQVTRPNFDRILKTENSCVKKLSTKHVCTAFVLGHWRAITLFVCLPALRSRPHHCQANKAPDSERRRSQCNLAYIKTCLQKLVPQTETRLPPSGQYKSNMG